MKIYVIMMYSTDPIFDEDESKPTVYGIFDDKAKAEDAIEKAVKEEDKEIGGATYHFDYEYDIEDFELNKTICEEET